MTDSDNKQPRRSLHCPHCGESLSNEWLDLRSSWEDGELQSQQLDCPHCGEDVTFADDSSTPSEQPEVVCLCGSTRFKDEFVSEQERLTMEGKIFVTVGIFGHADDIEFSEGEKEMLDELHKRKIDLADRIHVINVDGYVGDSTKSEIEYARDTGTEVTFLEES